MSGHTVRDDGTGPRATLYGITFEVWADSFRQHVNDVAQRGQSSWTAVLLEQVFGALAEDDPERLRAGLVKVDELAQQWIEALDGRPRVDPADPAADLGGGGEPDGGEGDSYATSSAPCDQRAACFLTIGARGTCPCGAVL